MDDVNEYPRPKQRAGDTADVETEAGPEFSFKGLPKTRISLLTKDQVLIEFVREQWICAQADTVLTQLLEQVSAFNSENIGSLVDSLVQRSPKLVVRYLNTLATFDGAVLIKEISGFSQVGTEANV